MSMEKKKTLKSQVNKKIKKEMHDFLKDESGTVSKETVLKIGIGSAAVLGVLGMTHTADAGYSHHNSINFACYDDASHSNHFNHSSY